jgi:hypothetical protein
MNFDILQKKKLERDLGVMISKELGWDHHVIRAKNKANTWRQAKLRLSLHILPCHNTSRRYQSDFGHLNKKCHFQTNWHSIM